jgi:hypothetical protein
MLLLASLSKVFFDRLATEEDREYFMQMLGGIVNRSFSGLGLNYEQCFGEGVTPMLWSGIQRNGLYDEINDIPKVKKRFFFFLLFFLLLFSSFFSSSSFFFTIYSLGLFFLFFSSS